MRGRAPVSLSVIACVVSAGGLGCGPDLPDRMWRSEHVRYFSRSGDTDVCPAIVDELEEHGAVIADALDIGRTTVSYYKFDGLADFEKNAECGGHAVGCAPNATARSPADFDRHELIHTYLAPYGAPPWLLTEGAAVALSCQHYRRPVGSWQDAYRADRTSAYLYGAGGWLVGYLLRMFRGTWFVNLYKGLQRNASAEQFAVAFKQIYGMSIDDVWAAAIGEPQAPVHCPWECGREAFAADGQPHALTPVCPAGSLQRTLDLPEAGLSRWQLVGSGMFAVRSCDGNEEPGLPTSTTRSSGPGLLRAPLARGRYFVEAVVDRGGTPTLEASVAPGEALSGFDCASAPSVPEDLATLGTLTLFYPSDAGPRFTRLATAAGRPEYLYLASDEALIATVCTGCGEGQSCASALGGPSPSAPPFPAGSVVSLPMGAAATISLTWF